MMIMKINKGIGYMGGKSGTEQHKKGVAESIRITLLYFIDKKVQ